MGHTMSDFLYLDGHKLGTGIGGAMAALVRQKYPRDTAKHLARAWDVDPVTAVNVVKGHCSTRTLAKAFRAEGWELIAVLGASITGETFEEYEERRLNSIIRAADNARQNLDRIRARREALDQRAHDVLSSHDGALSNRRGGTRGKPGDAPSSPGA